MKRVGGDESTRLAHHGTEGTGVQFSVGGDREDLATGR